MVPALPRLVAFDLDATLWWPEMYMLAGSPFRKNAKTGQVVDRAGEEVELMGDSARILRELATDPKWSDTAVAYVSRTRHPDWAERCLRLLDVADKGRTGKPMCMDDLGAFQQLYPGSKVVHFKRIHEQSGIDYKDMIFFDNERRNIIDVQQLGVTCVYTPDGMTDQMWEMGLRQFMSNHGH